MKPRHRFALSAAPSYIVFYEYIKKINSQTDKNRLKHFLKGIAILIRFYIVLNSVQ